MRIITIALFVVLLSYVCVRKRKFDYFSIASFSLILYYFPVFIGRLRNNDTGSAIYISNMTYLCIFSFGLLLLVFMIFFDKYYIKKGNKSLSHNINTKILSERNDLSNFCVFIVSIIGLVLMVITFINYGGFKGDFNKMNLLMRASKVTEYMKYIGLFSFVYSFSFKGKFINLCRLSSLMIILYTFLLGHRSFIVIGIIAIFMHFVGTAKPVRLVEIINKNKKMFLFILICLIFFVFVKNVFAAFMSGNYDLVISRLTNKNYYVDTLLESESNIIMNNLNNIVISNFKYGLGDFVFGIISLIPFVGGRLLDVFDYVSFEEKMNLAFNIHLSEGIGLGSNYIGEAYSIGNVFSVIVITILTLFFIKFLISRRNLTANPFTYTFLSLILTYFTFYIHRNSLIFLLTTTRAYLYILILLFILHAILGKKLLKQVENKNEK